VSGGRAKSLSDEPSRMNSGFTATRVACAAAGAFEQRRHQVLLDRPGQHRAAQHDRVRLGALGHAWPMLCAVRTTASMSIRPLARLGVPTQISETSESATA
jgi:hypothetical protein